MTVSQISIDTYLTQVKPTLTTRQQTVLNVIRRMGEACTFTVAEELGGTSNMYSGRFTELKNKGLIEPTQRRLLPTGSTAMYFREKVERDEVDTY